MFNFKYNFKISEMPKRLIKKFTIISIVLFKNIGQ